MNKIKKYIHKFTGDIVKQLNSSYYTLQSDGTLIPKTIIESGGDWEELISTPTE